jgi:GNAT superfamily N-acetyltransferase
MPSERLPFILRAATAADAELLSRLIVSAFSTHEGRRLDPPSSALKETPEAIRAKLATHGAGIAESDGKPIGCVLFTAEENAVLYIGRLAVAPAWRRRGLARALIGMRRLTRAAAASSGCGSRSASRWSTIRHSSNPAASSKCRAKAIRAIRSRRRSGWRSGCPRAPARLRGQASKWR